MFEKCLFQKSGTNLDRNHISRNEQFYVTRMDINLEFFVLLFVHFVHNPNANENDEQLFYP